MILIYNFRGILLAVLGGLVALGAHSLLKIDVVSNLAGMAAAAGGDLYLRITGDSEGNALISPNAGGHLWFVPIWVLSVVASGIGFYVSFAR
ncbi:MAG: hypothetical protein NT069_26295 [Planctomycetota bacterium]|nr:hypothetical protein [Planctomycetota bacterium]